MGLAVAVGALVHVACQTPQTAQLGERFLVALASLLRRTLALLRWSSPSPGCIYVLCMCAELRIKTLPSLACGEGRAACTHITPAAGASCD